jgi:hypothetical protein
VIRSFISFYSRIWQHYFLSHLYRQEFIFDSDHHYYRRYSKQYKKKQGIVKNFWIAAGIVMVCFPLLHVLVIITMATTFASFTFLDETK